MKRYLKHQAGSLIFASHFAEVLLRHAAVVVAFHRVHDAPDATGLTIDTASFEQYCRFFAARFHVVSLRELVDRLDQQLPVGGYLAITFDDGYRDNYQYAAPVLRSLSLPATFFVVSEWIGSDVVPAWDKAAGSVHAWMNWTEVGGLQGMGFTIGAHTRTHVDLGRIGSDEAEQEIRGVKADLEDRLGTAVDLFAYPYGGRANIAERNRELVRASGFRCCCSCHGGMTWPATNPFYLPRVPITPFHATPHQFGFDLILGRT